MRAGNEVVTDLTRIPYQQPPEGCKLRIGSMFGVCHIAVYVRFLPYRPSVHDFDVEKDRNSYLPSTSFIASCTTTTVDGSGGILQLCVWLVADGPDSQIRRSRWSPHEGVLDIVISHTRQPIQFAAAQNRGS